MRGCTEMNICRLSSIHIRNQYLLVSHVFYSFWLKSDFVSTDFRDKISNDPVFTCASAFIQNGQFTLEWHAQSSEWAGPAWPGPWVLINPKQQQQSKQKIDQSSMVWLAPQLSLFWHFYSSASKWGSINSYIAWSTRRNNATRQHSVSQVTWYHFRFGREYSTTLKLNGGLSGLGLDWGLYILFGHLNWFQLEHLAPCKPSELHSPRYVMWWGWPCCRWS